MKLVLLTCLVLLFNNALAISQSFDLLKHNPPPPTGVLRSTAVSQSYLLQKLDHFDAKNEKTWSQKYYTNTDFYNKNSANVVFLRLEGEASAAIEWMSYGSWAVSAKKYGALMFQLEHRFYGDSQPFPELTTESLRYLSSEQALADAANFIRTMNGVYKLPSDVKWIVFGASYSASLAAWLRLKYPDLVLGAVAPSGPLLAKLDFKEYYQVVIDDLAENSEECVANLKEALKQVDDLITNPSEDESLTTIFNLCEPIEELGSDDFNLQNFYKSLALPFAVSAQYSGLLEFTIDDICTTLTNEKLGKEIYRLAEIMKVTYYSSCVQYNYNDDVKHLKETGTQQAIRQWTYQTCTEFGWYQTTNREDRIFGKGVSVDFFTSLCADVFGPEFNKTFTNKQIEKTNAFYDGLNINVSNVVHIHGSVDPWHAAGLLEATNPESPVIYVEGTSHCAVIYEWSEGELPQLTAARDEVDRLIGVWLGIS